MDVPFVIRQRLEELGLEQRDLARAARVTESYVSQILTRKKAPPAPVEPAAMESALEPVENLWRMRWKLAGGQLFSLPASR